MFIAAFHLIPLPAEAPPLARAFALIMQGLRGAIGRSPAPHPAGASLLALLSRRVGRLSQWLARLALRAAQGNATPRRRPAASPGARRANPEPPPEPKLRLPPGPDWLFRLVPEAASFGSQLTHLLNQPEMAALLEAAPHAARKHRPLCRTLGVPWQNVTVIDLRPRHPERRHPKRPRPVREPTPPAAPAPSPPPSPVPATLPRLGWAGIMSFHRNI